VQQNIENADYKGRTRMKAIIRSRILFLVGGVGLIALAAPAAHAQLPVVPLAEACYAKCDMIRANCAQRPTLTARNRCERNAMRCTRGCQIKYG
jgi:hypothetical protein